MGVGDWLRGEAKGKGGEAHPVSTPQLEQLEPRLLLNADFVGIKPVLAPDAPCTGNAIFVDLDEEPTTSEADSPLFATESCECPLLDGVVDPSVVTAEEQAPGDSSGLVATGAWLDVNAGPESPKTGSGDALKM